MGPAEVSSKHAPSFAPLRLWSTLKSETSRFPSVASGPAEVLGRLEAVADLGETGLRAPPCRWPASIELSCHRECRLQSPST
jgi:hypothetical protein